MVSSEEDLGGLLLELKPDLRPPSLSSLQPFFSYTFKAVFP